ncbi:24972_t:CDS:1, partial [Dentiscutata erythropus]
QYDDRYSNWEYPFRRHCRYFKLLQSVDKNIPKKDHLGSLSDKGSLMKFKKLLHELKLDYNLFFWVKNVNSTNSFIYKNEQKLLKNFKTNILKRKKKKQDNNIVVAINIRLEKLKQENLKQEEYKLQSPQWHPQSPSSI